MNCQNATHGHFQGLWVGGFGSMGNFYLDLSWRICGQLSWYLLPTLCANLIYVGLNYTAKTISPHPSFRTNKQIKLELYFSSSLHNCSRDSILGIEKGYGLDGLGSNPDRSDILLFSTAAVLSLGPTQPHIQWIPGALSTGVKLPRREADRSPPSIVEVKDGGAIPPLAPKSWWHSA
jgi:hypothetical protein